MVLIVQYTACLIFFFKFRHLALISLPVHNHTLFFTQHYKITLDCTTPRSDQLRASLWHLIDILVNPSKGTRQRCSELERQSVCSPVCLRACAHMMMAGC